jgi:hypothetical protein
MSWTPIRSYSSAEPRDGRSAAFCSGDPGTRTGCRARERVERARSAIAHRPLGVLERLRPPVQLASGPTLEIRPPLARKPRSLLARWTGWSNDDLARPGERRSFGAREAVRPPWVPRRRSRTSTRASSRRWSGSPSRSREAARRPKDLAQEAFLPAHRDWERVGGYETHRSTPRHQALVLAASGGPGRSWGRTPGAGCGRRRFGCESSRAQRRGSRRRCGHDGCFL